MGFVLVPAGAVIALPWRPAIFTFVTLFIEPLLAPENQMTYDTQQFYNLALAIVVGLGSAALAFHLLPPLSPELRTRRLLALTLRDLHRLTKRPAAWTANDWKSRIYSRLCALPAQAESLQRAQLLTILSVGTEIIRLRGIARRFDLQGRTRCRAANDWREATGRLLPSGLPDSTACWPHSSRHAGSVGPAAGAQQHPCCVGGARSLSRPFRFRSGAMSFIEVDLFGVYVAPISRDDGRRRGWS